MSRSRFGFRPLPPLRAAAVPAALVIASVALAAPDDAPPGAPAATDDVQSLRREMQEMRRQYEERIRALEKRVEGAEERPSALQQQIDELVDRMDGADSRFGALATSSSAARTAYLDFSFNSLLTAGTSTARNDEIAALQGSHHDPHRRGFTVQNTELGLRGAVDPWFLGAANMVQTIDEEGETVVELEEAWAQTTSLPHGLQVKAGTFYTDFGRLNGQHPHQWEFVDQAVVNTRVFGDDGMRGPGARVSWLTPASVPLELTAGVQNANGNAMRSFEGPFEDGPPAGVQRGGTVRAFDDMVWSQRASVSVDLTDEMPALLGASAAFGPSGASESGSTSIVGADLTVKWKPLANDHGFPFVAFQSEWMRRHVDFDAWRTGGVTHPGGEFRDSGAYAQVVWGFRRDWTIGARWDHVRGTDDDTLGADDRTRWSAALTYYTSEFSKLRLQVNRDVSDALPREVTSVWLQVEFNLGQHGAHRF